MKLRKAAFSWTTWLRRPMYSRLSSLPGRSIRSPPRCGRPPILCSSTGSSTEQALGNPPAIYGTPGQADATSGPIYPRHVDDVDLRFATQREDEQYRLWEMQGAGPDPPSCSRSPSGPSRLLHAAATETDSSLFADFLPFSSGRGRSSHYAVICSIGSGGTGVRCHGGRVAIPIACGWPK
jgi:hypothetical protein